MKQKILKNRNKLYDVSTFKRHVIIAFVIIASTLVITGVEVNAESVPEQTKTVESTLPPAVSETAGALPKNFQEPAENVTTIPQSNAKVFKDIEKKGFKNTVVKFLLAMLGVIISAGAIFAGLKFYKKFVLNDNSSTEVISAENSLHSPKDFREAINLFLNKTDK